MEHRERVRGEGELWEIAIRLLRGDRCELVIEDRSDEVARWLEMILEVPGERPEPGRGARPVGRRQRRRDLGEPRLDVLDHLERRAVRRLAPREPARLRRARILDLVTRARDISAHPLDLRAQRRRRLAEGLAAERVEREDRAWPHPQDVDLERLVDPPQLDVAPAQR